MNASDLLPESIRHRLDTLTLYAPKIRTGGNKGERRSIKRGTSIEFADYRNYTPGDDLRKLDWNIYARLEKPYIKLLEDEEDLAVHVLLDASASMNWPDEADNPANKLVFAQRIFAALGYMALVRGDRLQMVAFNQAQTVAFGPTRGRGQVVPMLRYAVQTQAQGVANLNAALRDYAMREKRVGLVILISDMMATQGYSEGLNALLGKGHEVVIVQPLSPDELEPPLAGDLRLVDVETGHGQEVTIDATLRHLYQQRLQAWLNDIRVECGRKGAHYVMARTDSPWERVVLQDLRRVGVVK